MKIESLKDAMQGPKKRVPHQHHHHHHVCKHWQRCSCGYCYDCGTYTPIWRWQWGHWVWQQAPIARNCVHQ